MYLKILIARCCRLPQFLTPRLINTKKLILVQNALQTMQHFNDDNSPLQVNDIIYIHGRITQHFDEIGIIDEVWGNEIRGRLLTREGRFATLNIAARRITNRHVPRSAVERFSEIEVSEHLVMHLGGHLGFRLLQALRGIPYILGSFLIPIRSRFAWDAAFWNIIAWHMGLRRKHLDQHPEGREPFTFDVVFVPEEARCDNNV